LLCCATPLRSRPKFDRCRTPPKAG
jgi:hypothetical protein